MSVAHYEAVRAGVTVLAAHRDTLAMADAIALAIGAACGHESKVARMAWYVYHALARRDLLRNITRVDSFGRLVTGGQCAAWRAALYGRGLSRAQREFDSRIILPRLELVFIDLERKEDIEYILYERAMLQCTYGVEPRTVYQAGERADDRAGASDSDAAK